ncbi:MAG: right-handed parallel beta-helix repeat-containing protein [Candidatus Woesearchaeota archaeon]
MARIIILFLVLVLFACCVHAADYYVDGSVGSSGNGGINSPWKSLSNIDWNAISNAPKPCAVYISGGTTSQTYGALNIGASGASSGKEIIIKRPASAEWPGHDGNVLIRATSSDAVDFNGHSWIVLDGLDFSSSGGSGVIISSNNIVIRNCVTKNNRGFGIGAYRSNNVLVQNCVVGPNSVSGGDDPFQLGPASDWTIEKSVIQGGFATQSAHFDGIQTSEGVTRLTVRYNIFREANNAAFFSESIDANNVDVKVYGNIFEFTLTPADSSSWCWAIFNDKGQYYSELYIYNNVFVNFDNYNTEGAGILLTGGNSRNIAVIKNNIFYNSRVEKGSSYKGTFILDNNCYYSPSNHAIITWNNVNYYASTFANFKSATGQEAHGMSQDPLLASVGAAPNALYDLRPTVGSPCIDAGDSTLGDSYNVGISTVTTKSDWPGSVTTISRPQGSGWDIGAYEYGSQQVQTCSQQAGTCCQAGQTCSGSTVSTTDCTTCCIGTCQTQQQTCSQQGGMCCSSGQTCSGTMKTASDCSICCVGTCQAQQQTCSQAGGICCTSGQTCSGTAASASDCTSCCIGTCQTVQTCIAGDLNCDKKVDIFDLVLVAQNYGKDSGFDTRADANGDGRVDIFDLVIVAQNYGK